MALNMMVLPAQYWMFGDRTVDAAPDAREASRLPALDRDERLPALSH